MPAGLSFGRTASARIDSAVDAVSVPAVSAAAYVCSVGAAVAGSGREHEMVKRRRVEMIDRKIFKYSFPSGLFLRGNGNWARRGGSRAAPTGQFQLNATICH
jgi:hypothetical protein